MNDIIFIRENGNIPASLPGDDYISGLLTYIPDADLPSGFDTTDRIKSYSLIDTAEADGITADSPVWMIKALHHHLSEFFKMRPSGIIYVGIFTPAVGAYDYAEVKEMKNFAEGKIRQIGVYNPHDDLDAGEVTALKTILATCYSEHAPIVGLLGMNVAAISGLTDMRASGQQRVSPVIGQSGSDTANSVADDVSAVGSLTSVGLALGAVALAAVNESIMWVQKFNTGIDEPKFCDGSLVKETDLSVLNDLDSKGFIFLRKHTGVAGSYFNDSHNLDVITSDYAHIERVRTMDKAERGIRTYTLPYLGSPLYVNPDNGRLRADTVEFLQTTANKALEDMEKAGELSGNKVEIDPSQNVLSSSEVVFIIKNVATGVMRNVKMRISYATNV